MNAVPWPETFPRLYTLYLASEHPHPDNYFEHENLQIALQRRPPDEYLVELEKVLCKLDTAAWHEFKCKTAPIVTAKDHWGWPMQLFDCFNEARGYAYLKAQGCSEIRFIPETHGQKRPDLCANGREGLVLLEAKRVRESEDENKYLKLPMKNKIARDVVHDLPEALKRKLLSTITRAKDQLYGYPEESVHERIVFLSVRLDLTCATNDTRTQLEQFLAEISDGVEIVHRLDNEFLL